MSKIEEKRIRDREERRRRLINSGTPEDKVEQVMAQQDYAALPMDKKLDRLEKMIVASVQALGNDISALQHNDQIIAHATDANMRAMSKCLEKAGVPVEEQTKIMEEVQKEILREAQELEQQEMQEAHAKSIEGQIEKELMDAEKSVGSGSNEGPVLPDGATVFGE